MDTAVPVAIKKPAKRKRIRKFIIFGIIIVLVAGAVYEYITIRKDKAASVTQTQRTARVTNGEISVTITGSGPIASSDSRQLSPQVTSKLTKVNFKKGDKVKTGDVLFELDDTDARMNIENTNNNIAQTQLTLADNQKSVAGLTVKAPFSGQVTGIQVKTGDNVGTNSSLMTITDVSKLKVVLPFSSAADITVGHKATVYLQDMMQSVEGTVSYISSKPYISSTGGLLYNVEITVENPGSLSSNMKANAEIDTSKGTLTSVGSSTLAYINQTVIRSDAGGTVNKVDAMENQYVNAGDVLITLENDSLKLNLDTTNLKLDSLQRQMEIQQEQLSYYKITAPNDGTIATENATVGDTVKPGDVLAEVSDMGHMEFEVTIDELDIAKVKVGQKVNITVDALPDTSTTPLTGTVTDVAMEGTSQQGVTSYPVTITVDNTQDLKVGMNANAEIMINDKQNILVVPIKAVQKMGNRSFVWVQSNGTQTGGNGQGYGFGFGNGNGNNAGTGSGNGNGTYRRNRNSASGNGSAGNSQSQGAGGNSQQGNNGQQSQGNAQQGNNGQQGQGNAQQGTQGQGSNAQQGQGGNNPFAGMSDTQRQNLMNQFRSSRNGGTGNSYYSNARMVPVQTGINNDTYIEITSGLTAGEVVILPPATTSSSSQTNSQNRSGFGGAFGGFGGAFGGGGGGGSAGGGAGGGNNRAQTFNRGG